MDAFQELLTYIRLAIPLKNLFVNNQEYNEISETL